jgi:hypothetical protein
VITSRTPLAAQQAKGVIVALRRHVARCEPVIYPQISTYAAVLVGCGTGKPPSCNPSM